MDGNQKISLQFGEQEAIDISISYTPACSLYIALIKGLEVIDSDLEEMDKYMKFIQEQSIGPDSMFKTIQEKIDAVGNFNSQRDVARLAQKNSKEFLEELKRVINELDPDSKKKKPIIIAPPGWNKN